MKDINIRKISYIGLSLFLIFFVLIARNFEWDTNNFIHTLFELIATIIAFFIGIITLIRFYTKKNIAFLFIGSAFIATSFLDGYHTIVTSDVFSFYLNMKSDELALIPWSWIASRIFLSILLLLSLLFSNIKYDLFNKEKIQPKFVFGIVFFLTLITFYIFTIIKLPYPYLDDFFIHRPMELLPAVFFLLALIGYIRKGYWKHDSFEHWMIIALIISFSIEAFFMTFSSRLYDIMFNLSHILKIVSYCAVLVGSVISIYDVYKKEEKNEQNLLKINALLKKSLQAETTVRKIISNPKIIDDLDSTYTYFLDKLLEIFNVYRAVRLSIDKDNNFLICNESIKGQQNLYIHNKILFNFHYMESLKVHIKDNILIINDVQKEINNPELKENLSSQNIQSLLIYPVTQNSSTRDNTLNSIMICCQTPKQWTEDDKVQFRLIIDTVNIVFSEIKQKTIIKKNKEIEELRNSFIATLTHDLRSPILSEQKAIEFMISRKSGEKLEDYKDYLEGIYETNEELLRIVNNLLISSHFESGSYELSMEPNDIYEIISHSLNSIKYLAQDKKINIITNFTDDFSLVFCDRDQIIRVMINLISNAIKYNTEGTTITISSIKKGDFIEVSIADDGVGLSEDDKSRIFQKYPTKKSKVGTGLGLYLCKQIIDAHEGKIWFESELGKGTTFKFTLPLNVL